MSEQFTINVRQGPTANRDAKNLEAAFARRSMMLVRRLLGEDKLIELLRDETAASTEYWKTVSAASDGKWKAARIVLSPRGLSSMDFVDWFLPAEGGMLPDQEKLAAHPEHWVVRPAGAPQTMTVLETLGERPTLFLLAFGLPRAEFLYHQFRDHEDGQGFDVDLAIYFPAACGEDVVECHRQHLLVEFSNWSRQAYEAVKRD
ncbi:hypothetical protein BJX66DRAFT_327314 [Aspergillus keveii]|uniref:Uncharacterized protein n=1 Tax=Aspergillus keveii TaxID=714993 RepID=A0ABR4FY82_9EURO